MADDFDTIGRRMTPYKGAGITPVHEGSLSHYATGVYDEAGNLIGVRDEEIRKTHRRMVSGRSRRAHEHSGRPHHFVNTMSSSDSILEATLPIGKVRPGMSKNQRRKALRYGC